MRNDNNINQKSTAVSKIKSAMERFFLRKSYPPDMPYSPQPGRQPNHTPPADNSVHSETEANVNQLYGTTLKFGSQTTVEIDSRGRAKALTCKPSYIVGSGRRISDIEDVGGICRFCQEAAFQAFSEGKLTAEQAQLQSLFDITSARQCDICGIYTCSIHSRPVQTPQGQIFICTACRDQISREEKRKRIINLLLSPFTDNSQEQD